MTVSVRFYSEHSPSFGHTFFIRAGNILQRPAYCRTGSAATGKLRTAENSQMKATVASSVCEGLQGEGEAPGTCDKFGQVCKQY